MKPALALLLLGVAGCAKAAPAGEVSVWWPCVARGPDESAEKIMTILAEKGIDFSIIGSRGVRIWVPYERTEEAVASLRPCPEVRVNAVVAGPRPGSALPAVGPGAPEGSWPAIGDFDVSSLPASRVQAILNAGGLECGVIVFPRTPDRGFLYVPPSSVHAAKALLRSRSMGDALRIEP